MLLLWLLLLCLLLFWCELWWAECGSDSNDWKRRSWNPSTQGVGPYQHPLAGVGKAQGPAQSQVGGAPGWKGRSWYPSTQEVDPF